MHVIYHFATFNVIYVYTGKLEINSSVICHAINCSRYIIAHLATKITPTITKDNSLLLSQNIVDRTHLPGKYSLLLAIVEVTDYIIFYEYDDKVSLHYTSTIKTEVSRDQSITILTTKGNLG